MSSLFVDFISDLSVTGKIGKDKIDEALKSIEENKGKVTEAADNAKLEIDSAKKRFLESISGDRNRELSELSAQVTSIDNQINEIIKKQKDIDKELGTEKLKQLGFEAKRWFSGYREYFIGGFVVALLAIAFYFKGNILQNRILLFIGKRDIFEFQSATDTRDLYG